MRGRPKIEINKELSLKYLNQGLSLRQIATKLKVNKSSLYRFLKKIPRRKNCPLIVPKLSLNSSVVVKPKKPLKPPLDVRSSTNDTTPTISPASPLFDSHHTSYTIEYKGKQPVSSRSFHPNNNVVYVHELGKDAVVLAYTRKLRVWINKAEGNSKEEMEGRTSGRARTVLAELQRSYGLELNWSSYKQSAWPHLTLEDDELNEFFLDIFSKEPELARRFGLVAGDASHPDKIELKGKEGLSTSDKIKFVFNDMPSLLGQFAENQKVFNEQMAGYATEIREHRALIKTMQVSMSEMSETLKAIRNELKRKYG